MYSNIVTNVPHPNDIRDIDALLSIESRSMHGQIPIIWDRAENFLVYDRHGNVFIDFTSTIFVANAGHSNPLIIQSLIDLN